MERSDKAVSHRTVSIRLANQACLISVTCYQYQPLLCSENIETAEWYVNLPKNSPSVDLACTLIICIRERY